MNKYKVVFVDIDGTLRNDEKEVTEFTKNTIKKVVDMGIEVIICSGRPRDYSYNVSLESFGGRYTISSNGSEVYDHVNRKHVYYSDINKNTIVKLFNIAEKYNVKFTMSSLGTTVVNKREDGNTSGILLSESITDFVYKNEVYQCVISSNNVNAIREIKEKIRYFKDIRIKNESKNLINDSILLDFSYIDVCNKEVSKGNAIRELCEYLNINKEETIGIGDHYNDLSMFENVGLKVAMGNSYQDIKKIADIITDTNNNDGLAKALINIFKLNDNL